MTMLPRRGRRRFPKSDLSLGALLVCVAVSGAVGDKTAASTIQEMVKQIESGEAENNFFHGDLLQGGPKGETEEVAMEQARLSHSGDEQSDDRRNLGDVVVEAFTGEHELLGADLSLVEAETRSGGTSSTATEYMTRLRELDEIQAHQTQLLKKQETQINILRNELDSLTRHLGLSSTELESKTNLSEGPQGHRNSANSVSTDADMSSWMQQGNLPFTNQFFDSKDQMWIVREGKEDAFLSFLNSKQIAEDDMYAATERMVADSNWPLGNALYKEWMQYFSLIG